MPEVTLTVQNRSGLHARPAAAFVRAAADFAADVRVTNLSRDPGLSASAKSVLAIMGLGVSQGHEIRIEATGEDADPAIASLASLVGGGLDEASPP